MYNRTFWIDHVKDENGNVIQQGTNMSQDNFNNIELGIFEANIEQNINAIMNNLNKQDAAQAEPIIMGGNGVLVALVSGPNPIAFPNKKIRNSTNYIVYTSCTDSTATVVLGSKQTNGLVIFSNKDCFVEILVVGGIL